MLKKNNFFSPSSAYDYVYLTLLILLAYVFFLGAHPLLVPDEARYSEVAREMLANHQFLTPQVNGIDFFDKPILFYWLQTISIGIFGVNEWAIRLFPMLFGLFGVLIVYSTCKSLYNRQVGWIAALMLSSSPLYYFAAHYANLDLEVAVWITASLCFFIRAYRPQEKQLYSSWLYLAYITAGLAVLTKGLIGIVFPIMIIGIWIALTHQWFLIRQMKIISGLGIILLITLPWFIAVEYKNPGFSYYFFYVQQFLRFLTTSFNNIEPFWFYIPVLLLGFLPWTCFLYPAFKKIRQEKNQVSLFFVVWSVVIFVFFSIPHSKLIGYIIPVIPPLAILASTAYESVTEKNKRTIAWVYITLFALIDIAVWMIPLNVRQQVGITAVTQFFIVFFATFILLILAISLRRSHRLLGGLVLSNWILFNSLLGGFLFLDQHVIDNYFPVKTVVSKLKPIMKPNDIVVSYFYYYQDLPMYTGKTILIVDHWNKPGLASVDNWRGEFAYSMQYLQPSVKERLISQDDFVDLARKKQRLFIFVPKNKLKKWEQYNDQNRFCQVTKVKKIVVFTNDLKTCDL